MSETPTARSARWLWISAIWCAGGLFDASQTVLVMRAEGMHHAWPPLFGMEFASWLPWVLATPLILTVADIDWIEAADYYARIHLGGASHLIRRTLVELERDLGDDRFFRIHRSVIVNLNRIRGLELQIDGEYEVVLKSGTRLRLSRRFRRPLQDRLGV